MAGLGPQSCQQEELSRFRDDKRKPDQEKVASSEKDAGRKKCQRERTPRADAVNGRDNQSVRLHAYRLEAPPPFETSVTPLAWALLAPVYIVFVGRVSGALWILAVPKVSSVSAPVYPSQQENPDAHSSDQSKCFKCLRCFKYLIESN